MSDKFLGIFGAALLALGGCTHAQPTSTVAFAAGEVHSFQGQSAFLTAGSDGNVGASTTLSDLQQRYRNGAFQILQWDEPSGASPADIVDITSKSVNAALDSDLFVSDATGNVLRSSASPSGIEEVRNLRVDEVSWPMQIFIGAYGPAGLTSQVSIAATVTGTDRNSTTASDATVAKMSDLCGLAGGTFLARGSDSRCECNSNVVTFSRFVTDILASDSPADQAFLSACGVQSDAALANSMASACKSDGGTFLARATTSRCECGAAVITFARFKSDFEQNGQVQSAAFAAVCASSPVPPAGGGTSGTTVAQEAAQFRNACLANLGDGASLSGNGTSLTCGCSGTTTSFADFQAEYLDLGKTALDYQGDCSSALSR